MAFNGWIIYTSFEILSQQGIYQDDITFVISINS